MHSGANLATQMQMMWQQQYPVRFAAVLSCGSGADMEVTDDWMGEKGTSTDACRLFALAKEEHGSPAAMSFLFDLAAQVLFMF